MAPDKTSPNMSVKAGLLSELNLLIRENPLAENDILGWRLNAAAVCCDGNSRSFHAEALLNCSWEQGGFGATAEEVS